MAAITTAQAGDSDQGSTWTGGVVPVSGDTFTINHAVTVPVGVTLVGGTSPSSDAGAVAIAINAALTINGTLKYQGPVRQGNATVTVGAGGTITYDASLAATPATALYTWQISQVNSQANAKLVFNGSSGSHCTFNSVGNVQSGGLGNTGTNFVDGGRLEATYTDFSYVGPATTTGWFLAFRLSIAAAKVILDHCTLDHCAQINTRSALSAVCTFQILNTRITNPANTAFTLQLDATIARTTGVRDITNSAITGLVLMSGTAGRSNGFTVKHNVIRKGSYTGTAAVINFSNGASCDAWDQNILFVATDSTSSDKCTLPGGTLTNTYLFRHGNVSPTLSNPHPCYVSPYSISYDIDGWIWEYDGTDDNGDFLQISKDATAPATLNVHRNIFLPNGAGNSVGAFLNDTSAATKTNLTMAFDHNTCAVSGSTAGTNVYGVGAEIAGTTWNAGAVTSVRSNIAWRPASGTGLIGQSNSSATVAAGAVAVANYNGIHNVTGSIYGNPSNQWAGSEGANDITADPTFVDSARNLFKVFTGYLLQSNGTAWATATGYVVGNIVSRASAGYYSNATLNYRCITAHTSSSTNAPGTGSGWAQNWEPAALALIETDVIAGTTYAAGANSLIGEAIAWVRSGFAPTNAAYQNTGHDGVTIGAAGFLASPAPADPSGLNAVASPTSPTSAIDLSWSDNSDNESGFEIQWSLDGSTNWTHLFDTTANVTTYSHTGLGTNTTRYYRVKAINPDDGDSGYSNVASATTESVVTPYIFEFTGGFLPLQTVG